MIAFPSSYLRLYTAIKWFSIAATGVTLVGVAGVFANHRANKINEANAGKIQTQNCLIHAINAVAGFKGAAGVLLTDGASAKAEMLEPNGNKFKFKVRKYEDGRLQAVHRPSTLEVDIPFPAAETDELSKDQSEAVLRVQRSVIQICGPAKGWMLDEPMVTVDFHPGTMDFRSGIEPPPSPM